MKITYIYHSCFVAELEESVLIFDYFKGTLPVFPVEKHIYFFASHKHQDHFCMDIFGLLPDSYQVTYVLSGDIKLNERYLARHGYGPEVKNQIVSVGKNVETVLDNQISIQTLKSTDEGVAFVIDTEGISLYHAGDLNWWHWEGESKAFNLYQEQTYCEQLEKIRDRKFDAAFIPLDYRLGTAADWGMVKFLETASAKAVFPMHLWEHYKLVDQCLKDGRLADFKECIVPIHKENESWIL